MRYFRDSIGNVHGYDVDQSGIMPMDVAGNVLTGWTEVTGNWPQADTLADVKAAQERVINTACRDFIFAGFSSTALGSAHTYPCKCTQDNPDQTNMEGSVTESLLDRQNAMPWAAGATVSGSGYMIVAGEILEAVTVTGPTGVTAPAVPAVGATVVDGGVTWKLWSTPFWVQDAAGTWAFVEHTEKQIQRAGKDMAAFVRAQRIKCATLVEQINAASTIAAVQAVVW